MAEITTNSSIVRGGTAAAVLALLFVGGYGMYEHGQANRAAVQNQQTVATLQQTQQQVDSLTGKINELTAAQIRQQQQAEQAAQRAAAERAAAQHRLAAARTRHVRVRKDDPRWKEFQAKLDAQNEAIESTRQNLEGAKTELSGSIARTHDEVVLLQKKGERNYHEFDLSKAKQFQAAGPVGVKLRKANTKRQYADLDLMVDDVNLQQKHVNLYQPVVFYASDNGVPVELVINSISKDHIRGYVSEPKYKRGELAAMASNNQAAAAPDASTPPAPPQRRKLGLPKD